MEMLAATLAVKSFMKQVCLYIYMQRTIRQLYSIYQQHGWGHKFTQLSPADRVTQSPVDVGHCLTYNCRVYSSNHKLCGIRCRVQDPDHKGLNRLEPSLSDFQSNQPEVAWNVLVKIL